MLFPLAIRSPSCFGILRRNLNPDVLRILAHCYDSAIAQGGEELSFVRREPGVSFNPRPARVLEIAVSLATISDLDQLAAVCLATAPRILPTTEDEYITQGIRCLTAAIHDWLQVPVYTKEAPTPLLAVLFLDLLRHLHQCPGNELPDYREILTFQVPWLLSQLDGTKLKACLAQALDRTQLLVS